MHIVMSRLGMLRRLGQELGPYLMLEILLPGGTVLALLFFLYRRSGLDIGSRVSRTALAGRLALARILRQAISMPRSCYLQPSQAFVALDSPDVEFGRR
jgi:predicted lysophospholipase L1 biosynthesis ABC-type transport system permease subunit